MSASPRLQSALHVLKHGGLRRVELADLRAEDSCKLTNRLYGSRGLQANGLIWYWQTTPGTQVSDWVALSSHDAQLRIGLHGDVIGLDTRQFDWRLYEGETRLLAWTAAHEPLIELLRAVFRTDWVPEQITSASENSAPPESARRDSALALAVRANDSGTAPSISEQMCAPADNAPVRAQFSGQHSNEPSAAMSIDGRVGEAAAFTQVRAQFAVQRAHGSTVATGVAELQVRWLEGLAQRPELSQPRLHPAMSRVPAPLPILIDELDITHHDLTQIERGCILRLDNKVLLSKQPRIAIRIGRISWLADINDLRATVTGFADNLSGDLPVKDTVEVTTLPVRLSFSAGRLIVPFGNLSEVGPGYVFELDKRLDDQVITVHANETPIAVGELVSIGDMVGVRITRMLLKA